LAAVLWNLYAACFDLVAGLAPYQDMLDEVVTKLDLRPGMRVLDAGCGTGALEARLAQRHPDVEVVAVDSSPAMLARARRRSLSPGTRFVIADIDDFLAKEKARFDRMVSVNVIWALAQPRRTIERMAEGLAPGGRMVHTTPRWRFRFDLIVFRHLQRARGGRGLLRALCAVPALAVAGLLNLALVLRVLVGNHAWRDRSRWQADGLVGLFSYPGLGQVAVRSTYAGQGFLVTCDKTAAPLI
jgi:2-polyprenyl-3-methyl-5-hydroxy-6-metoxy-1,4-benzoquinol methylase